MSDYTSEELQEMLNDQLFKEEREAQQERAQAYEAAKKEEKDMLKLRIKNGKLTAAEEKKLEEARQKRRDNYDSWYKEKKKKEEEANKDAEIYAKNRQDEIEDRVGKESALYSHITNLNRQAEKAIASGNKEMLAATENLMSKTFDMAEAEKKIGTAKYTNIDYSTQIAALEKKRWELNLEYQRVVESGDPAAQEAVQRKIEANDAEVKGLEVLDDKAKIMNRQNEILRMGIEPIEAMEKKFKAFALQVEALVTNPFVLLVATILGLVSYKELVFLNNSTSETEVPCNFDLVIISSLT